MFSSAARGSYVFCPTATTAAASEEAENDSSTAINPPLSPTSSSFSVTAMDVDTSTNHPLLLSSIKQPHSPTTSESDKVSLTVLTAFFPSDITSITTVISTSEQPAKKQSRSSWYLGVSAKDIVSPAGKTTPASAVIGMQGSINWLTDIFERSMMSHLAKDPATTPWSCTMALVQEYDDNLMLIKRLHWFLILKRTLLLPILAFYLLIMRCKKAGFILYSRGDFFLYAVPLIMAVVCCMENMFVSFHSLIYMSVSVSPCQ